MSIKRRIRKIEKKHGVGTKHCFVVAIPADLDRNDPAIKSALEGATPTYQPERDLLILLKKYGEYSAPSLVNTFPTR
jgi:hypothetical protein